MKPFTVIFGCLLTLAMAQAAMGQGGQAGQIYERGDEQRSYQQDSSTSSQQKGTTRSRSQESAATKGDQFTVVGSVDAGALIFEALRDFEFYTRFNLPKGLHGTLIESVARWRVITGEPRFHRLPNTGRLYQVDDRYVENLIFPWIVYGELGKRALELLPLAAEKLSKAGKSAANLEGRSIASDDRIAKQIAVGALILAARDPITRQRTTQIYLSIARQGTIGGGGWIVPGGGVTQPGNATNTNLEYWVGSLKIDPINRTATLNGRPYFGSSEAFGRGAKIELAQSAAWQRSFRDNKQDFATTSHYRAGEPAHYRL